MLSKVDTTADNVSGYASPQSIPIEPMLLRTHYQTWVRTGFPPYDQGKTSHRRRDIPMYSSPIPANARGGHQVQKTWRENMNEGDVGIYANLPNADMSAQDVSGVLKIISEELTPWIPSAISRPRNSILRRQEV